MENKKIMFKEVIIMLAYIPAIMIGGFLIGCAVVIAASCRQLIRVTANSNDKRRPISKAIHA